MCVCVCVCVCVRKRERERERERERADRPAVSSGPGPEQIWYQYRSQRWAEERGRSEPGGAAGSWCGGCPCCRGRRGWGDFERGWRSFCPRCASLGALHTLNNPAHRGICYTSFIYGTCTVDIQYQTVFHAMMSHRGSGS